MSPLTKIDQVIVGQILEKYQNFEFWAKISGAKLTAINDKWDKNPKMPTMCTNNILTRILNSLTYKMFWKFVECLQNL